MQFFYPLVGMSEYWQGFIEMLWLFFWRYFFQLLLELMKRIHIILLQMTENWANLFIKTSLGRDTMIIAL
jgi:hypothetical protein